MRTIPILLLLISISVHAQPFSADWYKIAGGGGTTTGGVYSVTGTIGQHDATTNSALTGGQFSVTGGFWSMISVVQQPDAPNLLIVPIGPNSVQVRWPATGSFTLQQNGNRATTNWVTSGYTITTASGTNSITITPPTGIFFSA